MPTSVRFILQVCLISLAFGQSSVTLNNNETAKFSNDIPQILYKLNLTDAAATNQRLELGTLEAGPNGKQLRIIGAFYIKFPNTNTLTRVFYTADKQGYHASYFIGTSIIPPVIALQLSASALKSAAG